MRKAVVLFAMICMALTSLSAKDVSTKYRNALVFAYSPVNSIYEDDNIKLEIYDQQLWASNKTNRTIFIDKSQCFLINNGSSYPIWSKTQDEKKASKGGVVSALNDEFITIAPAQGKNQNETFICNLGIGIFKDYSTSESTSESFSEYEERLFSVIEGLLNESLAADPKGKKYVGSATMHLTEDESVSNIGASLAYAFNKRSEDWIPVQVSTWVCDVMFTPYYIEMPKDLSNKDKRGFGIKKTDPARVHLIGDVPFEFEEDKSPIIVCDWVGDYKKGTFSLSQTKIAKEKGKKIGLGLLMGVLAGPQAAAAFFQPSESIYYKSVVVYDGKNADWGKMSYAGSVMETKQSK